jgi:hypothetical protein
MNFLASVKNHEPNTRVIVYDLGMTDDERSNIEKRFNYEIRRFEFAKYPAFFNIRVAAGQYAWKPVLVREVALESPEIVCWMDAGNIIRERLLKLRRETRRVGFYSPFAPGTISDWTHPAMLTYFGLPTSWKADARNLCGGVVAFDMQSPIGAKLVNTWAECALIKECIAPEGSSRANHRQDQALLTVLAYMFGRPNSAEWRFLGFGTHCDVEG